MSQVYGDTLVITKQPTISSAATGYAVNDVVGSIQTLPCGLGAIGPRNTSPVFLQSVTIIEQSNQKAAFDIVFFDSGDVTVSADNAAVDFSDSNLTDSALGVVNIPSSAYASFTSNSIATVANIGLNLQPAASGTVWAVPVIRTASTYTVASGLVFKYGFSRDL